MGEGAGTAISLVNVDFTGFLVAARLRRAIARSNRKHRVLGDRSRCHEVFGEKAAIQLVQFPKISPMVTSFLFSALQRASRSLRILFCSF